MFDRFVGPWNCHYAHLGKDGVVTEEYDGRVTFGWIIEGWAMRQGRACHQARKMRTEAE